MLDQGWRALKVVMSEEDKGVKRPVIPALNERDEELLL